MKLERLFNVLVLGGAALGLAAACNGSEEGSTTGEAASGADQGSAQNGSQASGATTGAGSGSAQGGGSNATQSAGVGGSGAGSSGTGGNLVCSEVPDINDPCGCPCCWVADCDNDDGECCSGFCEGSCC
jgi:hypothetical protein